MTTARFTRDPRKTLRTQKVTKGFLSLHEDKGADNKITYNIVRHVQEFAKIADLELAFEAKDRNDAKKQFDDFKSSYMNQNVAVSLDKLNFQRDSQRAKVVEFFTESETLAPLREEMKEVDDARTFIRLICKESDVATIKNIRIVDNNRNKTVNYTPETDELVAPVSNLDTMSILFHTAYAVNLKRHLNKEDSTVTIAPHGPEFVTELLRLIDRYTDEDAISMVTELQERDIKFDILGLLRAFRGQKIDPEETTVTNETPEDRAVVVSEEMKSEMETEAPKSEAPKKGNRTKGGEEIAKAA